MSANVSAAPPLAPAAKVPMLPPTDASASPPASAPPAPVTAKKTTVITAAAKKRLRVYFIVAQWSLNRNLDTGQKFLLSDLGRIATELGPKRTQVSQQLLRYKEEKYGNTQIKLILEGDQLEEKMW